jgi:hypothetical protein
VRQPQHTELPASERSRTHETCRTAQLADFAGKLAFYPQVAADAVPGDVRPRACVRLAAHADVLDSARYPQPASWPVPPRLANA